MSKELEESLFLSLDFKKLKKIAEKGIEAIPVVVQHAETKEVLTLAYANDVALKETLKTRKAVFWSTSRNELWRKGETSGSWLNLVSVHVNCEQNSLLFKVLPVAEGVCHTRNRQGSYRESCYYRSLAMDSIPATDVDTVLLYKDKKDQ